MIAYPVCGIGSLKFLRSYDCEFSPSISAEYCRGVSNISHFCFIVIVEVLLSAIARGCISQPVTRDVELEIEVPVDATSSHSTMKYWV